MPNRVMQLGIIIVGILLVIAPIIYLYYSQTTTSFTVANSTWTLDGAAGISYLFKSPEGARLALATKSVDSNVTYVVIVKSAKGTLLLQEKVNGQGQWKIVLGNEKYYEINIINPLNTTLNGGIVAKLEIDTPLAASPSANAYLVISIIGALIVGWGVGRAMA
ncbi:MAG: hypothetical protein GXO68_04200 [Crenarchaeota archaeon]|nr:hypothetical protein [Thermoproteota archaeon]